MKCTFLKKVIYDYREIYQEDKYNTQIVETKEVFQDCIGKECSAYRKFNNKEFCKRLK